MQVSVKVHGLKEIQRNMMLLGERVAKREVLNPGLIAGAVIVRDQARALAPVERGVVRRNIIVQRWRRPDPPHTATVVIRVRKLKAAAVGRFKRRQAARGMAVSGRANPNDPYYWRFLEFGWRDRGGTFRQFKFLRPAFEDKKGRMVDKAVEEFRKMVARAIGNLPKRTWDRWVGR